MVAQLVYTVMNMDGCLNGSCDVCYRDEDGMPRKAIRLQNPIMRALLLLSDLYQNVHTRPSECWGGLCFQYAMLRALLALSDLYQDERTKNKGARRGLSVTRSTNVGDQNWERSVVRFLNSMRKTPCRPSAGVTITFYTGGAFCRLSYNSGIIMMLILSRRGIETLLSTYASVKGGFWQKSFYVGLEVKFGSATCWPKTEFTIRCVVICIFRTIRSGLLGWNNVGLWARNWLWELWSEVFWKTKTVVASTGNDGEGNSHSFQMSIFESVLKIFVLLLSKQW